MPHSSQHRDEWAAKSRRPLGLNFSHILKARFRPHGMDSEIRCWGGEDPLIAKDAMNGARPFGYDAYKRSMGHLPPLLKQAAIRFDCNFPVCNVSEDQ